MITKAYLLHKFVARDVIKNKMITVAGQMFIEYEKELDSINQIIKGYEEYNGDNKTKNDVMNKVFETNIEENKGSEREEFYKNNPVNRFFRLLNENKRELQ